jgi:hypothetical protein
MARLEDENEKGLGGEADIWGGRLRETFNMARLCAKADLDRAIEHW